MNRLEELELTVQMLCDVYEEYNDDMNKDSDPNRAYEFAKLVLVGKPCSCAELPFPHKRTRACFRRY